MPIGASQHSCFVSNSYQQALYGWLSFSPVAYVTRCSWSACCCPIVCLYIAAEGGKGGDCSLASTAQTPEPANSTGCDPSTKGNGLCDPNNNIASCEYDGGDCCQGTCKFNEKLASQGSCTEKSFNCRDPNGDKDVIPPILQGKPCPVAIAGRSMLSPSPAGRAAANLRRRRPGTNAAWTPPCLPLLRQKCASLPGRWCFL